MLNKEQKQRYLRNIVLPEIGEQGQEKLLNARVLVVGAGGLGSPIIYYLAAAGVGNIGVMDDDAVEISNLQRQIIHNFSDLGRKKVLSAREKVASLNKDVNLEVFEERAGAESLSEAVAGYDFVVDATDNFPTRFKINEICVKKRKTLIFGAVKGFLGQVSVFRGFEAESPCYACFNPNIVGDDFSLPLSEKGILGSVAGSVGAMQATNVIKEILGVGESLVGRMLVFDFLEGGMRKVKVGKRCGCGVCGG